MTNANISIAPASRAKLQQPPSTTSISRVERAVISWPQVLAASLVIVLAYGPLLWLFFRQQWEKPHYQYFPFVFAAFGWLLWKRYHEAPRRSSETAPRLWPTYMFLVAAVLLLVFGLAIRSPWCAMVSLILLVASILLKLSASRRITNIWGIWLLLWLVVPAPLSLDQLLITRLQSVSSRLSSFVLDAGGIQHLTEGNTLLLRSKQLFVDEACSGIISMLSILACAVIYAVVKNRTPLHLVALAVASIAWATLLNVVRISAIAYLLDSWGIDWSSGTSHELLSLALFLLAFLALLCTDQFLLACLGPIRPVWDESYGGGIRFGKGLASAWDRITAFGDPSSEEPIEQEATIGRTLPSSAASRNRFGSVLAAVFAPTAAVQCVLMVYAFQRAPERLPSVQRAMELESSDMPAVLCGTNKADFQKATRSEDNIQGKYSRTYLYRAADGTSYVLSFDFPFPGYWHELTECYTAIGWGPVKRQVIATAAKDSETRPWNFVEATFAKPGGLYGSLCFSEFDQFGVPYEPQSDWIREGVSFWRSRNLYLKERQFLQVQVWSEGPAELTAAQRAKARELLLAARERFRALVLQSPEPQANSPHHSAGDGHSLDESKKATGSGSSEPFQPPH